MSSIIGKPRHPAALAVRLAHATCCTLLLHLDVLLIASCHRLVQDLGIHIELQRKRLTAQTLGKSAFVRQRQLQSHVDTLSSLAVACGTDVATLKQCNNIFSDWSLATRTCIFIPGKLYGGCMYIATVAILFSACQGPVCLRRLILDVQWTTYSSLMRNCISAHSPTASSSSCTLSLARSRQRSWTQPQSCGHRSRRWPSWHRCLSPP